VALVEREDIIHDTVGGRPVVVANAPGAPVAYDRTIAGRSRRVHPGGPLHLEAAGTRWRRSTGEATDGRLSGRRLTPATTIPPLFWFAWAARHPDPTVYGSA